MADEGITQEQAVQASQQVPVTQTTQDGMDRAIDKIMAGLEEKKPLPTPMLDHMSGKQPEPAPAPAETAPAEPAPPAQEAAVAEPAAEPAPPVNPTLKSLMDTISRQEAELRALKKGQPVQQQQQQQQPQGPDLYEMAKKRSYGELFRELGLSKDDALDFAVSTEQETPAEPAIPKELQATIQTLQKQNEDMAAQLKAFKNEQFLTREEREFKNLAGSNEDKWKYTRKAFDTGGEDRDEAFRIAFNIGAQLAERTGMEPDKELILDTVERFYEDRVNKYSKWAGYEAQSAPDTQESVQQTKPAPSADGADDSETPRALTEEERFKRAEDILKRGIDAAIEKENSGR